MSTASDLPAMRPTWAEIDSAAFGRNLEAVAKRLPPGSRVIAVMKADAYGHGAAQLSKQCTPDRLAMIAVFMLEEALELRRAGVTIPILILGPMTEAQVRVAAENAMEIGVPGPEELEAVARVAKDRDVAVHLKIDSGMGRMGSVESELPRVVELVRSAPRMKVAALYTHFADSGDPDDPFTDEQSRRFDTLVKALAAAGVTAPLRHRANSAAAMRGLVKPGEYVRVGLTLYGAEPLDAGESRLEPVMRWRTEIVRLKHLPAGHPVGYGMTFRTERPTRLATLPAGYADGYSRLLSNKGDVLIRGRRAPVVGRVSMDLLTVDVTDIPGAALGDEVVLLGRQGDEEVSVEELAAKIGTISYEVLCGVSARVPRVYRDDGRVTVVSRFP
ncbi:MAG: alanine racemase [Thermoanaerobaculia bacterium]